MPLTVVLPTKPYKTAIPGKGRGGGGGGTKVVVRLVRRLTKLTRAIMELTYPKA